MWHAKFISWILEVPNWNCKPVEWNIQSILERNCMVQMAMIIKIRTLQMIHMNPHEGSSWFLKMWSLWQLPDNGAPAVNEPCDVSLHGADNSSQSPQNLWLPCSLESIWHYGKNRWSWTSVACKGQKYKSDEWIHPVNESSMRENIFERQNSWLFFLWRQREIMTVF